jgi:glucose/arabinose dehydrogenase
MKLLSLFFLSVGVISSAYSYQNKDIDLKKIRLPAGFEISVYANVPNARSMTLSPSGVVFVGTRSDGRIFAVKDSNKDGKGDIVYELDRNLTMPNGVAFRNGDLYVAEVSRILKYQNIEKSLLSPPEPIIIYNGYPTERHHGWKYIAFGPDGNLYVPVGAPCNVCDGENEIYAAITRLDINNPKPEIIAKGVRNSVGFDWDPLTGDLWFTDNGRDMMGDDIPPCELNHLTEIGEHFGFPYCHGGEILDPKFGKRHKCEEFKKPEWKFQAHVAPLGIKFYTGNQFPEKYSNAVFIAQHGSWNRSKKVGYRIMIGFRSGDNIDRMEVFASGWLDDKSQKAWGRPVAFVQMPDGSLLVSDDYADVIYRIAYTP